MVKQNLDEAETHMNTLGLVDESVKAWLVMMPKRVAPESFIHISVCSPPYLPLRQTTYRLLTLHLKSNTHNGLDVQLTSRSKQTSEAPD